MPAKAKNTDVIMMSDAKEGKVPGRYTELIVGEIMGKSAIMQLGKFVEMTDAQGNPTREKDFTFFAKSPGAYWVNESEKIQTAKPEWTKATMKAHKIGVIIPVSREFLYYDRPRFFEEVRPLISQAFLRLFDEAGILGKANPFEQSLESVTTDRKLQKPISYESVLELEDLLYDAGITPNGFISTARNNSLLRGAAQAVNGIAEVLYNRHDTTLDGKPVVTIESEEFKKGTLYAGDFDYLFYGIPYAMTYRVSEEAQLSTITNDDGTPVNLFEQELVALRVTMDVAFMIAKENAFAKIEAAPLA